MGSKATKAVMLGPMSHLSNSSVLGPGTLWAAPAALQPTATFAQARPPRPDAAPRDGAAPGGEQDNDLHVDLSESKRSELPEALKQKRRKTKMPMVWL